MDLNEAKSKLDSIDEERSATIRALKDRKADLLKEIADIDKILGEDSKAAAKASKPRGPRDNSAAAKVKAYVTGDAPATFDAEHIGAQLTLERGTVSASLSRLSKGEGKVIEPTGKRGEYRKVTQ